MREEPKDADYILITHDHYDHFSPENIGKAAKAETIMKAVELINTIKPSVAIPKVLILGYYEIRIGTQYKIAF